MVATAYRYELQHNEVPIGHIGAHGCVEVSDACNDDAVFWMGAKGLIMNKTSAEVHLVGVPPVIDRNQALQILELVTRQRDARRRERAREGIPEPL